MRIWKKRSMVLWELKFTCESKFFFYDMFERCEKKPKETNVHACQEVVCSVLYNKSVWFRGIHKIILKIWFNTIPRLGKQMIIRIYNALSIVVALYVVDLILLLIKVASYIQAMYMHVLIRRITMNLSSVRLFLW